MPTANHDYTRRSPPAARPLVDSLPFPAALWSRDHHPYALNRPACELVGFTERDYLRHGSLWLNQIHVDDRDKFVSTWKAMESGASSASCHYRFLPGGASRDIGVCEVLYAEPLPRDDKPAIWSVYTRESYADDETLKRRQVRDLFEGLAHEITNSLQTIGGEIDLLSLAAKVPAASVEIIQRGVGEIHELASEMSVFLAPPALDEGRESSTAIILEVMQGAGVALAKAGVRVRVGGRCALTDARVSGDFREALGRVVEFCGALLPRGGELTVESEIKEVSSSPRLEVRLINRAPSPLGVDERNVFRPYLKIQQRRAGLGLLIARQTLRRRCGDIIFQKQQDDGRLFSFSIQLPAQRPSPEGG